MELAIHHYPKMERCWLLKRVHGEHSQHAHFYTKEEALLCRKLIDQNKYPREKKYKYAAQRILTEEEFKLLNKRPRYYNVQKGTQR
ncbi:MAG: hypothetical protein GXZ11_01465 [Tissierellia bacterium]|nr:hypothetical protein [Tissierellia bacterium]